MFTTSDTFGTGRRFLMLKVFIGLCFIYQCFSISSSHAACDPNVYWKQIGPAPIVTDPADNFEQWPEAGIVFDIAIDPGGSNDQIIYVGTHGGVWKTTDGGTNWAAKTDSMPSLSIGAVALDPGNPAIVYAGTGTAFGVR